MSRDLCLDINKFPKIPLTNKLLGDKSLATETYDFLANLNDPSHPMWKLPPHCPYMVDHSLNHIQDVFVLGNRFLYAKKEYFSEFTEIDYYFLILAIWLHDVG